MPAGFLYLDSSALVKLVLPEPESAALVKSLADWEDHVSSALAAVEVMRATYRASPTTAVRRRARRVVDRLHLVTIDAEVLATAARLEPRTLRSLDAVHLASALVLQPDLESLVTYDLRLAEAARQAGIAVMAPS